MIGMGKTFQLFIFYGVPPYDYFVVDDLFHHIKNNYLFTQILNVLLIIISIVGWVGQMVF
jgi:hypothetical protein